MKPGKRINKPDAERIGTCTLAWCVSKYGPSRGNQPINLALEFTSFPDKSIEYGEYQWDTNTIVLFYNAARTPRLVIATVIHEYAHSQQRRAWYTRYDNMYGYFDNPYEKEAFSREKDWKLCFSYLTEKNLLKPLPATTL